MTTNGELEKAVQLLSTVKTTVQYEHALRAKYDIGEKFKFIRDRLQQLQQTLETELHLDQEETQKKQGLAEDETYVYIYLFNAQGLMLKSWHNMLRPDAFYEFSVNRPIYGSLSYIEELLRSKANLVQHGYLMIAVKKVFLKATEEDGVKDVLGNPLIKVKEGSLRPENVVAFIHNGLRYALTSEGVLVKKEEE